mmetsp:Transcript_47547/g.40159  ORF Transcript_47547/g.40159 Transcript_47547/m.40159 type:complete len:137 (+) Transcript_47547:461-871(+)
MLNTINKSRLTSVNNERKSLKDITNKENVRRSRDRSVAGRKDLLEKFDRKDKDSSSYEKDRASLVELTEKMLTANKERDFYFNKLRNIEMYIDQNNSFNDHVKTIYKILTTDDTDKIQVDNSKLMINDLVFNPEDV